MRFSGIQRFSKFICIVGVGEFAGTAAVSVRRIIRSRWERMYEHHSVFSILEEKFIRLDSQNR